MSEKLYPKWLYPHFTVLGYKIMGQLTDLKVKNAKHCAKEYVLPDGDGLYLHVRPTRKIWFYRYTRDRKSIKLSLGRYQLCRWRRRAGKCER